MSILTNSPTVLDDLETLKRFKHAEVGFSITTSDDALSRQLDAKAPIARARPETVKTLVDAGIQSYVFVGPFLPHMYLLPDLIDDLFSGIRATGVEGVKIEYLNLPSYVRQRLGEVLKDQLENIQAVYAQSQKFEYRDTLEPMIHDALTTHGLRLRFNEIVRYVGDQNLKEIPLTYQNTLQARHSPSEYDWYRCCRNFRRQLGACRATYREIGCSTGDWLRSLSCSDEIHGALHFGATVRCRKPEPLC